MNVQEPTGKTRKKAVTIQDVARRAGTAKSTASMALNGKGWVSPETRELVLQAAREMNFEINPLAKRLSVGRDMGTIVLLSHHLDIGVGSQKVQLIQRLLNDKGFNAPIQGYGSATDSGHDNQFKLIRELRRQKPQAIVCNTNGKHMAPESLCELQSYCEEGGYLLCYDWPVALQCDSVVFDREENTYQAARHLLDLGHRKVGLYHSGYEIGNSPRFRGFSRALEEQGCAVHQEWLYVYPFSDPEAAGKFTAEKFLASAPEERPTGMCMVNDITALVFVTILREHGVQVPHDVSVVGHDDLMFAKYGVVPLTTMSQPVEEIAHSVANIVTAKLLATEEDVPRNVVLHGELHVRQSTAPPKF